MTADERRQGGISPVENLGPVIEGKTLRLQTGGDAALARDVLGMFAEECEAFLLLPIEEGASFLAAVHRLKGTARSLGAASLALACEAVEEGGGAELVWGEAERARLAAKARLAVAATAPWDDA